MNELIIVIILSIVFSAFFSGMEIAFYQLSKLKVELDKNQGLSSARILSFFVNKPSDFITNTW
jgi:putative hemolysin